MAREVHQSVVNDHASERPTGIVEWAVSLGTVVLIGVPTFTVAASVLADLAGSSGAVRFLALVSAALVAGWTTVEVTAWRLHGSDAVTRGSRRGTLARAALLSFLVVALAGWAVSFLVRAAATGWRGDPASVAVSVGLVLGAAGYAAAVARGFYRGYRAGTA